MFYGRGQFKEPFLSILFALISLLNKKISASNILTDLIYPFISLDLLDKAILF